MIALPFLIRRPACPIMGFGLCLLHLGAVLILSALGLLRLPGFHLDGWQVLGLSLLLPFGVWLVAHLMAWYARGAVERRNARLEDQADRLNRIIALCAGPDGKDEEFARVCRARSIPEIITALAALHAKGVSIFPDWLADRYLQDCGYPQQPGRIFVSSYGRTDDGRIFPIIGFAVATVRPADPAGTDADEVSS
jgi:hypothetical protein